MSHLLNYANVHDNSETAGLILDTANRTAVETLMAVWIASDILTGFIR